MGVWPVTFGWHCMQMFVNMVKYCWNKSDITFLYLSTNVTNTCTVMSCTVKIWSLSSIVNVYFVCFSICNVIPGISKLLLPRINPFALIAVAGAAALVFVYLLIDIRYWNHHVFWYFYQLIARYGYQKLFVLNNVWIIEMFLMFSLHIPIAASLIISRGAEGPGREILQCPPSVRHV